MREHDPHSGARDDSRSRSSACGNFDRGNSHSSQLHVRTISLAEREIDTELLIGLSEFVQSNELALATRAGTHIERYAKLVTRGASDHDARPFFLLFDLLSWLA